MPLAVVVFSVAVMRRFLQRHFMVAAAASTIAGTAMNEVGASEAMPVRPLPTVQPSASTPPTPISAAPPA